MAQDLKIKIKHNGSTGTNTKAKWKHNGSTHTHTTVTDLIRRPSEDSSKGIVVAVVVDRFYIQALKTKLLLLDSRVAPHPCWPQAVLHLALDVLLQNQRRLTKSEDRKMQRPAVLTLVVKDQTCSVLSTEETFTLWMLLRICTVHLGTLLSLSLSVLSLSSPLSLI